MVKASWTPLYFSTSSSDLASQSPVREPSPRAREAELISRRGSLQLPPRGLRPRPGGATVLPARPEAASSSSNSGSSSRGSAGRPGAGVPGARMGNQLGSHLGER